MTSTHDMAAALAALAAGKDDDARAAHVDRLVVQLGTGDRHHRGAMTSARRLRTLRRHQHRRLIGNDLRGLLHIGIA